MYCLIKKVFNNFNSKPNYFNVTYSNVNSVAEYIQMNKMLIDDTERVIERTAQGSPLKWYANDFPLDFAITDEFTSNLGKNLYQFLKPDNSKNYAYWLYYGNSINQILWAGEIDMRSLDIKIYPGEYRISCNITTFEKHLQEYLLTVRAVRYPDSGEYLVTTIFTSYQNNSPTLRFSHPSWHTTQLNSTPLISNPLYNSWVGGIGGFPVSAWEVFEAYCMEIGIAFRIKHSPNESLSGFPAYFVEMFFPWQNNDIISINNYKNLREGITASDKPYVVLLLTKYEREADPDNHVTNRYGYYLIRLKDAVYGYNKLPATEPPDNVLIEFDYQPEIYQVQLQGYGLYKKDILEIGSLKYFSEINGYKQYISFARCIVNYWQMSNNIYYDSGSLQIMDKVVLKNMAYMANGRKEICSFETEYNEAVKYAVSVNGFRGKNWWLSRAGINEYNKIMSLELIQK